MRLNQINGNKPERVAVGIRNADTVQINTGQPVTLYLNGTDDGLAVALPSTVNNAQQNQGCRFGVACGNVAVGALGEAMVFGFHPSLFLLRQTRSAATGANSWATEAARSVGEYLKVDVTNNGFIVYASTIKVVTNNTTDTLALTINNPDAVLAQTLASYAGSATATSDTRTAITAAVKAFVRLM